MINATSAVATVCSANWESFSESLSDGRCLIEAYISDSPISFLHNCNLQTMNRHKKIFSYQIRWQRFVEKHTRLTFSPQGTNTRVLSLSMCLTLPQLNWLKCFIFNFKEIVCIGKDYTKLLQSIKHTFHLITGCRVVVLLTENSSACPSEVHKGSSLHKGDWQLL